MTRKGSVIMFLKGLRNVISILIGLITYFITETLLAYIFLFLLKIPVLSFLMTGVIPMDIFLSASVATGSALVTFYVVKLISNYDSTNYSVIIVFLLLLIFYIVSLVYEVSTTGFDFTNLSSTLIFIGTFVFSCFMAKEEIL